MKLLDDYNKAVSALCEAVGITTEHLFASIIDTGGEYFWHDPENTDFNFADTAEDLGTGNGYSYENVSIHRGKDLTCVIGRSCFGNSVAMFVDNSKEVKEVDYE
jgi:hypothetical protein